MIIQAERIDWKISWRNSMRIITTNHRSLKPVENWEKKLGPSAWEKTLRSTQLEKPNKINNLYYVDIIGNYWAFCDI